MHAAIGVRFKFNVAALVFDCKLIKAAFGEFANRALPNTAVFEAKWICIPLPVVEITNHAHCLGMGSPSSTKATVLEGTIGLNTKDFVESVVFAVFPKVEIAG